MEVWFKGTWHFDALARITFVDIIIESPAEAGNAEAKVHERSCGKEYVADKKVLGIEDISVSDEADVAPHVISEHGRNTCDKNKQ